MRRAGYMSHKEWTKCTWVRQLRGIVRAQMACYFLIGRLHANVATDKPNINS